MTTQAHFYVNALQMQPHPEGGFYRETYRSSQLLNVAANPNGALNGDATMVQRSVSTGIYFLLESGNFSAFHRIQSDEMWHFYAGQALEVLEITEAGALRVSRLGPQVAQGEVFQHVVPARTWFASRVAAGGEFSLVGCTVAPGFDFADFELADRAALGACFPQHQALINALTR